MNLTLDRVWSEVEKNSFIALPGKGGTDGVCLQKMLHQGGSGKEFYSIDSMAELLIR